MNIEELEAALKLDPLQLDDISDAFRAFGVLTQRLVESMSELTIVFEEHESYLYAHSWRWENVPKRRERARALLLSVLDDDEKEYFADHHVVKIRLPFCSDGRVRLGETMDFFINPHYHEMNVSSGGTTYCAGIDSSLDTFDNAVAQVLYLKYAPEEFFAIANFIRGTS